MIRGVKIVSIPVSDQDRALEFYTDKLGFKVATDQPMGDGKRWIEAHHPGRRHQPVFIHAARHEDRVGGFQGITFWVRRCCGNRKCYESERRGTGRGFHPLGVPAVGDGLLAAQSCDKEFDNWPKLNE